MKTLNFIFLLNFLCLFAQAQSPWTSVGTDGITTTKAVGIGMNPFILGGALGVHDSYLQVMNNSTIVGGDSPSLTIQRLADPSASSNPKLILHMQYGGGYTGFIPYQSNGDGLLKSTKKLHLLGSSGITLNYKTQIAPNYEASALFVQPAFGDIGIHTLDPLARLHVKKMDVVQHDEIETGQNCGILIENNGWRNHDYAFEVRTGYINEEFNPLGRVFTVANTGTVHIGSNLPYGSLETIPDPLARLHVKKMNVVQHDDIEVGQNCGILVETNGWRNHDYAFEIRTGHINEESNPLGRVFTVANTGTVHIGNNLHYASLESIPWIEGNGYKLIVGGAILAEELRIQIARDNGWGWADYVFEDNYELMPLSDLELFIKNNNHLPGVPTTEDVTKEGIDVGDMNRILLEKIEELTLYVIDLKNENEELKKEVDKINSNGN